MYVIGHQTMTRVFVPLGIAAVLSLAEASLVAYWPLDDGVGQTARDTSGHDLHGVLGASEQADPADPAWVNDSQRGVVLEWQGDNGPGQWVDLTAHLDRFRNLDQGSILAWVRLPGADAVDAILAASDSRDPSSEIRFFYDPAFAGIPGIRYDVREGGDAFFQLSTFPVDPGDDRWHAVGVTVDASGTVVLYVDGVAVTTSREVGFFSAVNDLDTLSLGRNVDSGGTQWVYRGRLSDVAVFDCALPAAAVQAVASGRSVLEIGRLALNAAPADGTGHVPTELRLEWSAPVDGPDVSYDVFLGADPALEVEPIASGLDQTYCDVGPLATATRYFWRVDTRIGADVYRGLVWQFETVGRATDPVPADGSENVYTGTTLSWQGDTTAGSYDVYMGTSQQDLPFRANVTSPRYQPGGLQGMTRYWWRVDVRNPAGERLSRGDVWTFTTDAAGSFFEQTDVFIGGTEGYHTYRIPAILVAANGDLLAFCEGRKTSSADHGDVDIVMKRSSDNGRTWGPLQLLYEEGGTAPITIGNPCPVMDRRTGRIWLPFCRDNRRVFLGYSDDHGHTWSARREITGTVADPDWTWYATGPGVGIQLARGEHAGRLVIPSDHRDTYGYGSHMIYSDDGGVTWARSEPITPGCNECQVVELADGTLMNNMRSYGDWADYRKIATSPDGGRTWSQVWPDLTLIEPTCQASFLRYTLASEHDRNRVLFSNPASTSSRVSMTVRLSYDEGRTWPIAREVYAGSSAYSCLTVLPDMTIGCLYERDSYRKITFARFSLEWLTRGQDAIRLDRAHDPDPVDGAANVPVRTTLRWSPGAGSVAHRVYMGTAADLTEADLRGECTEPVYDPGLLDFETMYHWRVDERLDNGRTVTGMPWRFTTAALVCRARLLTDLNDDCMVDMADLLILAESWLIDETDP